MSERAVLVVDDEPDIRSLLQEILEDEGYAVSTADTAAAAQACVSEARPDLVLLDINLPDMDGYEILEKMRAHPQTKDIPAIAITANAMMDDVERGEKAGFNDYLIKPVKASELLKSMQVIIDEV